MRESGSKLATARTTTQQPHPSHTDSSTSSSRETTTSCSSAQLESEQTTRTIHMGRWSLPARTDRAPRRNAGLR